MYVNTYFRTATIALAVFLVINITTASLNNNNDTLASTSPYDSGYDYVCDDAKISDSSDRYINQPEKGPSFHT